MADFYATYGSLNINGQTVPVLTGSALHPNNALAPMYAGRGAAPPTLPAGTGAGNADNLSSMAAAANPWSFQDSPIPWLIIFLVGGWLGLRYIHWRG